METTNQSKRRRLVLTCNKRPKLPNAEQIIRPSLPDRLSDLPDSVLCHILSFIPTKLSVSTSILATRWRFLWAHVLDLDFDFASLEESEDQIRFSEIINRVMVLRKVWRINSFSISNTENFSNYELDTWISAGIARDVQALHLYFHYLPRLPRCLFTSKTLVDLRLSGCCLSVTWVAVCLPSLKKLHLYSVKYELDRNLLRLISGCPVLEELYIQRIITQDLVCCSVSSPTIKWLKLDFEFESLQYDNQEFKLEINTPALRYLFVEDHLSKHISAGTLDSLVEADICLDNDVVKEDVLYSRSVLEFVERLCQVKCLRLSSGYVKFLDSAFNDPATRFRNLTKLELAADWRFLGKFLECADNLEVLIIREVDEDKRIWIEPDQVPVCLSFHLRTVTVHPFGCLEDEFEMVGYILKNAKVLDMMDICAPYLGSDEEPYMMKRISLFQRASPTCMVLFL